MHFATAPCKISGRLPEIFLIEREGRALPPFTVSLLLSFCSLSFCFGVSLFILQYALLSFSHSLQHRFQPPDQQIDLPGLGEPGR